MDPVRKETRCNPPLVGDSADTKSAGNMTTNNNNGTPADDRPDPSPSANQNQNQNPSSPTTKSQLPSPSPWAYEFSWGDGVILFDGQVLGFPQRHGCSEPISSGADGVRTTCTTSASFHTKALGLAKSDGKKQREESNRGQNKRDKSGSRSG